MDSHCTVRKHLISWYSLGSVGWLARSLTFTHPSLRLVCGWFDIDHDVSLLKSFIRFRLLVVFTCVSVSVQCHRMTMSK